MIRVGLSLEEKQKEIDNYLGGNNIRKVFVLYYKAFKPTFKVDCEIEYVEYDDIIMYKFFYRLLEEIDNNVLIVVDELMRTQNRSELTYNCAHHYLNQTKHKIIFEYFPFIADKKDALILLDFQNKGKYKGKGFDYEFIKEEDFKVKPINIKFKVDLRKANKLQEEIYDQQKEKEFEQLGRSDPDILPRHLHLFVGKFKEPYITNDKLYVARNKRFKQRNITTYHDIRDSKNNKNRIIIDFPCRQIEFNDYLKITKTDKVEFLSTGLPVDNYYQSKFEEWLSRLEEFYAEASLY